MKDWLKLKGWGKAICFLSYVGLKTNISNIKKNKTSHAKGRSLTRRGG
jgi:hypothetical protein